LSWSAGFDELMKSGRKLLRLGTMGVDTNGVRFEI